MCCTDTLELIVIGVLIIILICIIWAKRGDIIKLLCSGTQCVKSGAGIFGIGDNKLKEDHYWDNIDADEMDGLKTNPLYEDVQNSIITHEGTPVQFGQYLKMVYRDDIDKKKKNDIVASEVMDWANNFLTNYEISNDMETLIDAYNLVDVYYTRLVNVAQSSSTKKKLLEHKYEIMKFSPSGNDDKIYDSSEHTAGAIIKTIENIIKSFSGLIENPQELTELDKQELMDNLIVPKHIFEQVSTPGRSAKVAIGAGVSGGAKPIPRVAEYIKYTPNYLINVYGDGKDIIKLNRSQKIELMHETLDYAFPIRIGLHTKLNEDIFKGTIFMGTDAANKAEEARALAFDDVMQSQIRLKIKNSKQSIDRKMDFAEYLVTIDQYTHVNSVDIHEWAVSAMDRAIKLFYKSFDAKKMSGEGRGNPEYIFSAYTTITRYYYKFIRMLHQEIEPLHRAEPFHKDMAMEIRKRIDYLLVLYDNLNGGYESFIEGYYKDIIKFSTEYIYSLFSLFRSSADKVLPKLLSSTDSSKLHNKLKTLLHDKIEQVKFRNRIINATKSWISSKSKVGVSAAVNEEELLESNARANAVDMQIAIPADDIARDEENKITKTHTFNYQPDWRQQNIEYKKQLIDEQIAKRQQEQLVTKQSTHGNTEFEKRKKLIEEAEHQRDLDNKFDEAYTLYERNTRYNKNEDSLYKKTRVEAREEFIRTGKISE